MSLPAFQLLPGPHGTVFHVRLSPGSSRERVVGEYAGALKVSVRAPAEKGKANAALVKLLAKAMGVERKSLAIISGETSRAKRILLRGRDAQQTEKLLHRAMDESS